MKKHNILVPVFSTFKKDGSADYETFEKLCDHKTALYIESPAYVYETLMDEFRQGTLRIKP